MELENQYMKMEQTLLKKKGQENYSTFQQQPLEAS
jgi:hypothetical protein